MAGASFALQKAVFETLTAHAGVTSVLGGPRVYDEVPPRADFPYLTFGQTTERDWSTGTEGGSEHILTLHVWSRARGRKETDDVMAATEAALHDAVLTLDGHRLINLRHESSDARREADGETYHGVARYRAVTEPL
ncbi:MAG: DUF3168 domain-containing protein [Hyphomicrobium sp.]|nr:DUF3168 domain-containing protein [Hyphomicrobium sp.]